MADISYKRTFEHPDWIDNEDVVEAGGEKGFNAKFHAIEAEFDKLSTVISQISAGLVVVSPTTTLSFAPAFFPNLNATPWAQNNGVAAKATNQPGADGWMPVQFPDRSKIQTITVVGEKSGNVGSFIVQLSRQSLTGGGLTNLLTIPLADKPDVFQFTDQVPDNLSLVDNGTSKYLVTARVVGADPASTAKLSTIQARCVHA
jgi:hypothetical protein